MSQLLMGAIARCLEQFGGQIGSNSVVERVGNGGSKSGGCVVCGGEAAKRAARQEKETWDDKRAGGSRRLEGNKSTVIRVRPRHGAS